LAFHQQKWVIIHDQVRFEAGTVGFGKMVSQRGLAAGKHGNSTNGGFSIAMDYQRALEGLSIVDQAHNHFGSVQICVTQPVVVKDLVLIHIALSLAVCKHHLDLNYV
jgi:predicted choloylglycine hydrolase